MPPDKLLKPQDPVLEGKETSKWIITVDFIDKYALAAEISEIKTLEFPSIFFLTTSVYSKLQPVLI